MLIISGKKYKLQRNIAYIAAGTAGAFGLTGTTLGTIALVKSSKLKDEVNHIHTEMERRMATEEGMSRQFTKAISQMQDAMEDHNLMRPRR